MDAFNPLPQFQPLYPDNPNPCHLHLVIMAGGSGTRFWPKSTAKKPKQLLSFPEGGPSLLTQTLRRFDGWVPKSQCTVITTQFLQDAVAQDTKKSYLNLQILAEPMGRNTAPCIYWAARAIAQKDPSGIMLVMPSDHLIAHPQHFLTRVQEAAQWAYHHDDLVTLGIQPTRPETGYGYLKTSALTLTHISGVAQDIHAKQVDAFVEKPSLEKAMEYVASGNYLWNGGMFLWKVAVILDAFDQWMPEMKSVWEKTHGKVEAAYPELPAISIDYGIMEKAKNVVTFPLQCGWDDLGSWTSLEDLAESLHARQGTNVVTSGQLVALNADRNIVDAPHRLIALLGVENLIIAEHQNTILVAHKDQAQNIRQLVEVVRLKYPERI